MTVLVLLGTDVHPWQRTVAGILQARHGALVHAIESGVRPSRSAAVAVYARLDRWEQPTRADFYSEAPALDELTSTDVVVDLTSARAALGLKTSATVLLPRPTRLDELSLLGALVDRQATLDLEVVDESGEAVGASTISLIRFSARRSSTRAAHRLATLLGRAIEDRSGRERLERPAANSRPASSLRVGTLMARAALAAGRIATTRRSWRVRLGSATSADPFSLASEWRTIEPPPGHWYADPFLAGDSSAPWLFVEDFDLELGRATIAAVDLGSGDATTVVSAAHHLSYPFVFEVAGVWHMIPETSGAGHVVLYRCDAFPFEWSPARVLLDSVVAYDTTLVHRDGLWWMFFAAGPPGTSSDDELQLWFSEELGEPFRPHPANPIRSSVVGSRPAGRIVERGGRLLRPGQDSGYEYGGSIVIHEIDCLSTTAYDEHTVARIEASAIGASGIHTFNRLGDRVVVDTKHAVPKFARR